MSRQIMNGGIEGAILRIVKTDGEKLSSEDEERLNYLEGLPKNEWIDLDDNGKAISKEQAEKEFQEHLSRFKPISNDNTRTNR